MRKNLSLIVLLALVGILLVAVLPARAASETLTNNTAGMVDNGTMTRTVTATLTGTVTDVNITIDFHKIDSENCAVYGSGSSWSYEISLVLTSPQGTSITLVEDDDATETYTSTANASRVTVTFDDAAATTVGGPLPVSGTFKPVQALSAFNGENPQGTWTLTAGDNGAFDALCFYSFTLSLSDASTAPASVAAPLDVFEPGDARINRHAVDRAAPVAIYCQSYGIQVYDVDGHTGKGSTLPIISLSYEEVDAMGIPTDAPLLLAESGDVTLWRLTTGEFQVNAYYEVEWKPWAFLWDACPMTSGRHLNN
jgi:hypothetical protein